MKFVQMSHNTILVNTRQIKIHVQSEEKHQYLKSRMSYVLSVLQLQTSNKTVAARELSSCCYMKLMSEISYAIS